MAELVPLSLQNEPSLIETVYPAQKVSIEAQAERKAVAAQTLTGLGSYWKGRKPLILVRSIILGTLLPPTADSEADLEIFEKLMAFDDGALARRAYLQNSLKPADIVSRISLSNPWNYFTFSGIDDLEPDDPLLELKCPFDCDEHDLKLRWRRDIGEGEKLDIFSRAIATFETYEDKAACCKRPEEVDQDWLLEPIWRDVNAHYARWGLSAYSIPELVEQLGVLRFGHRPRVGDTFSGGGSIPFEAARIGCNSYASDLNPIACMLTWGALNIIGASNQQRTKFEVAQREVSERINEKLTELGVEHDAEGNRAKAFLYCLETRCPQTGWMVPMLPSRIISPKLGAIAELKPIPSEKRFEIEVVNGVSGSRLKAAETGTIDDGDLVYELDGRTYRTPVKTLRGDYRGPEGNTLNRLRRWEKNDFVPRPDDILQERLYAIQWITKDTVDEGRQITYFRGVTKEDAAREGKVEELVRDNLAKWQQDGLCSDMEIDPGAKTDEPVRTRGWSYWHHLFNPRQILLKALALEAWRDSPGAPLGWLNVAKMADFNAKLSRWKPSQGGGLGGPVGVFSNQALNTFYNYAARSWAGYGSGSFRMSDVKLPDVEREIVSGPANAPQQVCELWVTDPPYADAVNYHEITEFFIAWLRKNPPEEFADWTWDSRRALAIKGAGDDFRKGMVDAYSAMAKNMPDNGMQCVMFTHQDTNVWSDMVGIFWAAGLQVVAAWYIATETTSELKKGGYVQGTVILMLRKRSEGERVGFKQRILPAVRSEVARQIESMMHLNQEVEGKLGEPIFNDSDLQMAGYAAALKVLTQYTKIGDEDVTSFALRPRRRGEVTVVDEIVQQAAEAANELLVPEGLSAETWKRLGGIQRFYLRMMDMETTGASKLDNYQNFAKAFRVEDYTRVMGSTAANSARLKAVSEFASRDLTDSTEIGPTWLGRLFIGLQQLIAETDPQTVVSQIQGDLPDFMEARLALIDLLAFIEAKAPETEVRSAAEVLGARLRNQRALGQ